MSLGLLGLKQSVRFCGISKFFDRLRPDILVQSALQLGFPTHDLVLGLQMHLAPRRLTMGKCVSNLVQPFIGGCLLVWAFHPLH